jgi:hypothetical protein
MLIYTKSHVIALSFLFTVKTATRVILMLLAFHRLTSFLGFYISLEHGLHEGHTLIVPNFLVGLLRIGWFFCCCTKGLTFLVNAMAVTSVVHLVGAAMGFAMLAKLVTVCLLRDSSLEPPDAFRLRLLLVLGRAAVAFPFALSFSLNFSP